MKGLKKAIGHQGWLKQGKGSRTKSNQKGFTLIELLIVMGLIGVVSIPVFAALTMGLKIYQSESVVIGVEQDQRAAISQMEAQVRRKPDLVQINESGNVLTVDDIVYEVGSSQTLQETQGSHVRAMCERVVLFEMTDVKRDSAGKILSFSLTLTTETKDQPYTLKTSIQLDRY